MNSTDDEIISFLKHILKYTLIAAEQLVNKDGLPMPPNFILSSHFILMELTNQMTAMEMQLRSDPIRKSRNDYKRRIDIEKEFGL